MASGKSKTAAAKSKAKPVAKAKAKSAAKATKPKARAGAGKVTGKNPLLEKWTTPFGMPPFDRIEIEHFMPAFDRALCRQPARRSRPSPDNRGGADFRQHHRRAGALGRHARSRRRPCSSTSPAPTPTTRSRRSSARSRRASPSTACASIRTRRCSARVDALMQAEGQAGLDRGAGARAGALPPRASSRRARRSTRKAQASGSRRSPSGWRRSAPSSARTCWPTSRPSCWCWSGEDDLAGLPESVRAAAAQAATERGHHGQARHHAVALQRRAVPAVLGAARSAREGVQGLDHARRQRRQDRQPADRGRDPGAARRARAAARLQDARPHSALEISMAKTPANVRKLLDRGVGAGARARAARSATTCRRPSQAEGGNFKLAAWDWRYYAEKVRKTQLRRRRGGDQALPAARQRHRRGLRRGEQAVRRDASRSAPDVPVYHPDVRAFEVTTRRPARRPVPRRLLRAAVQALRRLDVGLARAGASSTADVRPIVVNVMNFAKGAPGEPTLAQRRRCAHAVPRVRPRACTACCPTSPTRRSPAPAWSATSSSCPRSSTSTG